jgi:hypothetical protein
MHAAVTSTEEPVNATVTSREVADAHVSQFLADELQPNGSESLSFDPCHHG